MTNGIGPSWFPDFIRVALTRFGSSFFKEAAWDKHDVGYDQAIKPRHICDRKFLQAMLRDASDTQETSRMLLSTILAWLFWSFVRVYGRPSYKKPMSRIDWSLSALPWVAKIAFAYKLY